MKTQYWAPRQFTLVGLYTLCALTPTVHAQSAVVPQRDPTLPPIAAPADTQAGTDNPAASFLQSIGSYVVVRDGKPFLAVDSRLVAPGQAVGDYKLARITETEIWLRDANGITKVARYSGVERRAAKPTQCSPQTRRRSHSPSTKSDDHEC